jgi:dipeptidyl aminopeptidase/acylaminoacyl peptidase
LLAAGCGGGDDNNTPNVAQLNALTGATRTSPSSSTKAPTWRRTPSPDGQRIAFTARKGALWVIPFAGGEATRITPWTLEPTHPVWSPDGSVIAFQNYTADGNWHIWTVRPDGSDAKEITTGSTTTASRCGCRTAAGSCSRRPQQRRAVQDLELHPLDRRLQAADDRARRREQPGRLAGRQADRLRRRGRASVKVYIAQITAARRA